MSLFLAIQPWQGHSLPRFVYFCVFLRYRIHMFITQLPSNGFTINVATYCVIVLCSPYVNVSEECIASIFRVESHPSKHHTDPTRYIAEESNIRNYRRENLKSYIGFTNSFNLSNFETSSHIATYYGCSS
jgi:hypothetical protein